MSGNSSPELITAEQPEELPITKADLRRFFRIKSDDTIRRWIKTGGIPTPDVRISERDWGWQRGTLVAAGFPIPAVFPAKPIYELAEPAFNLYRHFDAAGVLLYVGVSMSAVKRLAEHRHKAPWFWNIARVEIARYATRQEVLDAERDAVKQERPLFNVIHATRSA